MKIINRKKVLMFDTEVTDCGSLLYDRECPLKLESASIAACERPTQM